MDDVWILGVAHQELYVYHMRPRVLYNDGGYDSGINERR